MDIGNFTGTEKSPNFNRGSIDIKMAFLEKKGGNCTFGKNRQKVSLCGTNEIDRNPT